jgi:hypothetical protein
MHLESENSEWCLLAARATEEERVVWLEQGVVQLELVRVVHLESKNEMGGSGATRER